jgi:hypothetical protein
MDQGVGVAVSHAELTLEHVADLPVLLEAALADDRLQLCEGLAGALLDVRQLRLDGLVDAAHGMWRFGGRGERTAHISWHREPGSFLGLRSVS